jgi:LPS-assembly lipoprotein
MSSFNRRTLLTLPLALAACGFTPAYGPSGPAQGLQEARFGRSKYPRYALAYTITTEAVGVGYATDTSITRYNLKGRVDWSLTDSESDARIAGGTAQNFTSWSATSATVAAFAAEQDAAKRLMVILADQVAAEIIATSVRFIP